jgi:filamentous hemagglutinin family protein
MKSRKSRKAKQEAGFSNDSRRLNSIVQGVCSLKQKALTGAHLLGYTLLLSHVSFVPYAYASPTGGTVVGGAGTITQSGVTTDIYQASSSMAIDWSSYDLSSDEIVNYYQPDSNSLSLNRILSNDPSQINGQINANGHIILVNPNGLFFGDNASVNVGGLIASGLDISPDDFMNGNYLFNEVLGTNGTVINTGLINAATGGNVTLLGKQVQNQGVISANLGAVNMAAGKQAVLTFDNQGLIGISVTKEILQDELGIDPAILNSGEINASGGRILLTASQSRDIFSRAVNTGDLTQATSVVVNEDGSFDLTGGADVVNSGTLNASATDANSDGGTIALLGQNVTSSGTITADSQQGNGGNIELHSVDTTLLTQNSVTSARAAKGCIQHSIG